MYFVPRLDDLADARRMLPVQAIAVNNAATVVDPSARLLPGHSSDQR